MLAIIKEACSIILEIAAIGLFTLFIIGLAAYSQGIIQ